jgi:hypothetical protein
MRLFTLIMSPLLAACGIGMILSGDASGWFVTGFFALCILVALFEPRFPKPWLSAEYRLLITKDDVACEHPKRPRETIRWADVNRIWHVTISDGPSLPDEWILLEGEHGGCSVPTEAIGFDRIWDELKQRFAGFDYEPFIRGGTDVAKQLCWERPRLRLQRRD